MNSPSETYFGEQEVGSGVPYPMHNSSNRISFRPQFSLTTPTLTNT